MDVTTAPPPAFDPFTPKYHGRDRYQLLAPYREAEPPIAVDVLGLTWVYRYSDAHQALLHSDDLEAPETAIVAAMGFEQNCPFHNFMDNAMIAQNAPRHTRLRKAQAYFGRQRLKALAPSVRDACDTLIDGFPQSGVVEFAYDFAFKLPVGVIMRILNLRVEDEDMIGEWSPPCIPGNPASDTLAACNDANAKLRDYVEEAMQRRQAQPIEGDIISDLLALERDGGITHDEIWAQVVSMIVAGHETTSGALGLLMHTLLENPGQLELLRDDPSLVDNAAYEILRFEPPVDHLIRRANTGWEIHGRKVEPGHLVAVSLSAANRDPRQFADPDRFDVTRENANRHLAFGFGIHRCLGASLAVLEIQIALRALLERLASFELAGEPRLHPGVFRNYESLPIRVERRS